MAREERQGSGVGAENESHLGNRGVAMLRKDKAILSFTQYVGAAYLTFGLTTLLWVDSGRCQDSSTLQGAWEQQVLQAFVQVHQGYSVDEVLIQRELRESLVTAVKELHRDRSEQEILESLLRARKQGKIETRAKQRGIRVAAEYLPAAEIAARLVCDQAQVTTDEILVNPELRARFVQEAQSIAPQVTEYSALKGILQLRKSRRLQPELVLKVANWDREVSSWSVEELTQNWSLIPETPGIYLFRDSTGYLYIGEAQNLRVRLQQHLTGSDRAGLQATLVSEQREAITLEIHAFAKDSPASRLSVRRAYESELIRSREPRLNLRP
jgi:hypothetical protein